MTRISRIEKACKSEHFLERVYTKEEINRYREFPARLAGNFAVKEALAKTFGSGFRGFMPGDIEVLRDEVGKPYVNLYGNAKKKCESLEIAHIFVTITNEDDYVCATVIAEGIDHR